MVHEGQEAVLDPPVVVGEEPESGLLGRQPQLDIALDASNLLEHFLQVNFSSAQ